ncbi:hypothetical protein HI914_04844 [Erysiphe necator]|nr:hypothetical protein HI914_04844 [Erysiphe necator]
MALILEKATKDWAISQGVLWYNSPTVDILQRVLRKKSSDPKRWPEVVRESVFEVNKREINHLLHLPSEILLGYSPAGTLETNFPKLQRQIMVALLETNDDYHRSGI